ncbi:MAG TPA: hypothetical protein VGM25_00700 [Caulobacteraceae bacterium]|jgi:hypothetical protein
MRPLMIAAVLALAAALPAQAQEGDGHKPVAAKAVCHVGAGKAAPCAKKPAKGAAKTPTSMPMITRCRDITSHRLAKCGGPNAEPVPAN